MDPDNAPHDNCRDNVTMFKANNTLLLTEAPTSCRVVVAALLNNCRVPSSVNNHGEKLSEINLNLYF